MNKIFSDKTTMNQQFALNMESFSDVLYQRSIIIDQKNMTEKTNQLSGKRRVETEGRATIMDVARMAGVSKSTVSLVLQDSPLVKSDTRDLVKRTINQLGYIYNRSAAGLRRSRSDFVGIVIGDLTNPFFPELAAGIEDILTANNLLPVLANANENTQQQTNVIRALREHGVAGIILSPARGTSAWSLAEAMPKNLPVVITMRAIDDCPFPYVGPDNVNGVYKATSYLVELGHRRIAFLGGNSSYAAQRERVRGWLKALEEANISADTRLIFDAAPTRQGGSEAISSALTAAPDLTAAVCYNDVVALGASRELSRRSIQVGSEFSLVGFDNIVESAHSFPPLTTINAGTRAMGRTAAMRLLELVNGERQISAVSLGQAELILRKSTAIPKSRSVP